MKPSREHADDTVLLSEQTELVYRAVDRVTESWVKAWADHLALAIDEDILRRALKSIRRHMPYSMFRKHRHRKL